MADARERSEKKDRGLFASARKLARAAVTRAIERLTGMPLSGDPWATRGLLDAPDAGHDAGVASGTGPVPVPKGTDGANAAPAPAAAAPSTNGSTAAKAAPAASPAASAAPAAAPTSKPSAPSKPAAAPVKASPPPVAPSRAGTVPGIGPTAPTPAKATPPAGTRVHAKPSAPPTRPAPPAAKAPSGRPANESAPRTIASAPAPSTPAPSTPAGPPRPPAPAKPVTMTPRTATAPRAATGPVPMPAPGAPSPLPAPEVVSAEASTPESEKEPMGILDFEETPETYGIDEVAVIARDPRQLFVYWEVTPAAWERARHALGGNGTLTLRLFVTVIEPHGGSHDFTRDVLLTWDHGRRYVDAPARHARVSAAVGLVAPDGRFVAMAYAPPTVVPSGTVAPDAAEEWMDVAPAGPPGTSRVPPRIRAIGTAAQVAAAMAAAGRGHRRHAAGGAAGRGVRLPSGLFAAEVEEQGSTSSWPSSPGAPGGLGGSSLGGSSLGGSSWSGSSPSPTSPGKVQR